MKDFRKLGSPVANLVFSALVLAGCSSDDVAGVIEDSLPDDGGLDDGSDRTSGGVFSTGTWKAAGINADGNPFSACFNVSVDGDKLTTNGSSCTDNQNAFSVDVDGSTDCNFYYDNDVPINSDGTFSVSNYDPHPQAPILSMQGQYSNGDASGTITVDRTRFGGTVCTAKWVAYAPGNTTNTTPAPDPDDDTTAPIDRPASGTWLGSGTNAEGHPFTACLVVNADGTALTRNNTCTGNQGQNNNQFDVQIDQGVVGDDDDNCYLYLGDGEQDSQIEVPIVNNRIVLTDYKPSYWAPALNFEGTFNGNTVSGTITINSQWGDSCKGSWSATSP